MNRSDYCPDLPFTEEEQEVSNLVCDICGEHIASETYYWLDDHQICEDCLHDYLEDNRYETPFNRSEEDEF